MEDDPVGAGGWVGLPDGEAVADGVVASDEREGLGLGSVVGDDCSVDVVEVGTEVAAEVATGDAAAVGPGVEAVAAAHPASAPTAHTINSDTRT